jgi:hypothetical protein
MGFWVFETAHFDRLGARALGSKRLDVERRFESRAVLHEPLHWALAIGSFGNALAIKTPSPRHLEYGTTKLAICIFNGNTNPASLPPKYMPACSRTVTYGAISFLAVMSCLSTHSAPPADLRSSGRRSKASANCLNASQPY